jgi:uncharacterized membrane protein (UPF0182 family)
MSFRLSGVPLLLLLLLLGTAIPALADFYTDWLWYKEVGYEQVFLRTLAARATTGFLTGLAVFGVLWLNLRLALRTLRSREFTISTPEGARVISVDTSRVQSLFFAGALILSLFIGLYSGSHWDTWLYFLHAVPFGRSDPVLQRDISFYVFSLPLLEHLHGLALLVVFLSSAGVLGAHVMAGNLAFEPVHGFFASRTARRQLAVLAAALLLVLAFGAWLQIPQLLTASSGVIAGASYVDVHARMPAYRLLMIAALLGSALAVYQTVARRLWPIAAAGGIYLAILIGGGAYAAVIQRFVVAPNEQVQETPYIQHNIQGTRAGFALEHVTERALSGESRLTRADLDRNAATIENVPLWNEQPLLDTFGQIQEIRTYYDFISVDNDRYTINGKYRQVMLSARELNSASLPSRTWINEHLTFTHGYGLALGPVNEVAPEGLPVLFIRDLPPVSTGDLKVSQPALYYGELSNDHVFVKTKTEEFDYPRGEDNVFAIYTGEGGVPLSSLWRRVMFAIRFRSTDTLFSPNLTSTSRVMLHRRPRARANKIAPFLTFDPDPYLAISNERLVWVQDAYTTTSRYPYANSFAGVNYIRNAVKVTIDAYHGTTRFHLIDESDPIAATIGRVFPSLFRRVTEMPEDLRNRMRYPQMIFSMQAAVFATFHMTNPAVFYNREDQWEIPLSELSGQLGASSSQEFTRRANVPASPRDGRMEPYYTIMKLPGEEGPEFIQMLPFTPRQKDNLAAWMVARSDGKHYGRLAVFQFPKQTVIFGPRQIAGRINQDQVIAPQITLWNQQGSEVIQGTLLVIPIEESLLYIRPLYLKAAGGRIPELKRVIVAHQNQIVMEETLDAAIQRLFPGGPARPPVAVTPRPEATPVEPSDVPAPPADVVALAAQARAHYERAIKAQREGNWALYGEEIKLLGEVLDKLSRRQK